MACGWCECAAMGTFVKRFVAAAGAPPAGCTGCRLLQQQWCTAAAVVFDALFQNSDGAGFKPMHLCRVLNNCRALRAETAQHLAGLHCKMLVSYKPLGQVPGRWYREQSRALAPVGDAVLLASGTTCSSRSALQTERAGCPAHARRRGQRRGTRRQRKATTISQRGSPSKRLGQ